MQFKLEILFFVALLPARCFVNGLESRASLESPASVAAKLPPCAVSARGLHAPVGGCAANVSTSCHVSHRPLPTRHACRQTRNVYAVAKRYEQTLASVFQRRALFLMHFVRCLSIIMLGEIPGLTFPHYSNQKRYTDGLRRSGERRVFTIPRNGHHAWHHHDHYYTHAPHL